MFLSSLRQKCERLNIPLISPETENFLHTIIQEHKPQNILEIGTAIWYSSIFFAKEMSAWNGVVFTFEISYPSYIQWLSNISQSGYSASICSYFLDFSSISLSKIITQKFDMIFIDAQKSQYLNYLMKISNLIADHWVIILDDIIKYQNKTNSLYEYLWKNQINYQIYDMEDGDGIMVINASELRKIK